MKRKLSAAIVVAVLVAFLSAGAVYAATWQDIFGNVFNNSTGWKLYTKIRTLNGGGNIQMEICNYPENGEIDLRAYWTDTGGNSTGHDYDHQACSTASNIASGVLDGTRFQVQARVTSVIFDTQDTYWDGQIKYPGS